MEYLPKDLIYEIVLRLPVKGLIRFSLVSKLWRDVIHNRDFIKEHEKRLATKDFTLIRHGVQEFQHLYAASFSGDALEEEREIKRPLYKNGFGLNSHIITVGHGLVLLDVTCSGNASSDLCLWNPVIAKHRYIRSGELKYPYVMYGIVYRCDEGDIKVLALKQMQNRKIQFMVYSVASGQWEIIRKLPPDNLQVADKLRRHNMVSLSDSRVAWLMKDVDGDVYHVVTFDLVKEEYSTLRVPISIIGPGTIELMELGSFLCFRHCEKVWFVKDSSWSTEPISLNNYSPLLFDGERFLLSRFRDDCKKLFWYNMKTRVHQHVRLIGHYYARDFDMFTQTAFLYKGGLHLLLDGVPDLYA